MSEVLEQLVDTVGALVKDGLVRGAGATSVPAGMMSCGFYPAGFRFCPSRSVPGWTGWAAKPTDASCWRV